MPRIGIVGDKDTIWPFGAFDVAVFAPEQPGAYLDALNRCVAGDFGMIFLTEDVYRDCPERVEELRLQPMPAVIILPGVSGSTGLAAEGITRAVRKALGTDII